MGIRVTNAESEPGMIAVQRIIDGRLQVIFLPAPHRRSPLGILRSPGALARVTTSTELEEAVSVAITAEMTGRDASQSDSPQQA